MSLLNLRNLNGLTDAEYEARRRLHVAALLGDGLVDHFTAHEPGLSDVSPPVNRQDTGGSDPALAPEAPNQEP